MPAPSAPLPPLLIAGKAVADPAGQDPTGTPLEEPTATGPLAPPPIVYTPSNAESAPADWGAAETHEQGAQRSSLDDPPAAGASDGAQTFEPVPWEELAAEGATAGPPESHSAATMANDILGSAILPSDTENGAESDEPAPLVISEDLTLLSKSHRKRRLEFRLR